MANMNTNAQGMTCEQMKAKIKAIIDEHNGSEDLALRNKLNVEALKLKDDYNKTSLKDVYAAALEAENPMLAFVKAYTYPTLTVSSKKDTNNLSLKDDGKAVMNLWDFVEFAAGRNKQVTKELDWKAKAKAAQDVLVDTVEKFIESDTKPEPGELKAALQAAFDSVLFISGKNDANAVIAKSKACRIIIMTCSNLDAKSFQANFGQSKTWQKQFLAFLNRAVEGKEFTLTFGDSEDQTTEAADTAEAEDNGNTADTTAEAKSDNK